jgi:hypothetical protein
VRAREKKRQIYLWKETQRRSDLTAKYTVMRRFFLRGRIALELFGFYQWGPGWASRAEVRPQTKHVLRHKDFLTTSFRGRNIRR